MKMNKTYIKRQLTLHKLDIPMNKNIQEYVDLFNELIGDPSSFTKETEIYNTYMGYIYLRNDNILLFYDDIEKSFWIHSDIWRKFTKKFNLKGSETIVIFSTILEETFNCEVNKTRMLLTDNIDMFRGKDKLL